MITSPFLHEFVRASYSDLYLLSHLSEEAVQAQIVEALQTMGLLAWVVDVGAKKVRGRAWGALRRAGVADAGQLLRAKHPGASDAPQGFPDIHGLIPPHLSATGHLVPFYIEVKRPLWLKFGKRGLVVSQQPGKPTPEQVAFLLSAHQAGACCGVAWSVADAVGILKKWLRHAS